MARLRIDDLAREAGLTTRNIRAYQDKGLLPPPAIVGRTGWYDDTHLARLRVISRLLGRGFSLAAIADLLASWDEGRDLGDILGVGEATLSYTDEEPVMVSGEELEARFGGASRQAGDRAVALGLIEPAGDGWRVLSPRMLDAANVLVEAGYPLDALLDEAERLQHEADEIACRFLDLWETHIWEPVRAAGAPPDEVARVAELMDRSRLVPSEIMRAVTAAAMRREAERRLERTLAPLRQATTESRTPDIGVGVVVWFRGGGGCCSGG
jgi:DNA-binding transcriptional MerR regulator